MTRVRKTNQRRQRNRVGRIAEWLGAVYLMARGYRILERRFQTHVGEIDIIAVKGRRVACVEVKYRQTRLLCEAAITGALRKRVRRAGEVWLSKHPKYQSYDIGFDLLFLSLWQLPQYLENSL